MAPCRRRNARLLHVVSMVRHPEQSLQDVGFSRRVFVVASNEERGGNIVEVSLSLRGAVIGDGVQQPWSYSFGRWTEIGAVELSGGLLVSLLPQSSSILIFTVRRGEVMYVWSVRFEMKSV